ncbi:hypothetical protein ACHQM5_013087 [Ranunculus cassubicifolius]
MANCSIGYGGTQFLSNNEIFIFNYAVEFLHLQNSDHFNYAVEFLHLDFLYTRVLSLSPFLPSNLKPSLILLLQIPISRDFQFLTKQLFISEIQIFKSQLRIFKKAPEIYKDEVFDRSVDSFSFGIILYELIEGAPPSHPKPPEEVAKLICIDKMRLAFKVTKSKGYPTDLRELIDECWNPEPVVRPTFLEVIVRLDKIVANCSKHGWWKDTFKFPWK